MSKLLSKEDYQNFVNQLLKHESPESCLNFYEKEYGAININLLRLLLNEVRKRKNKYLEELRDVYNANPDMKKGEVSFTELDKLKELDNAISHRQLLKHPHKSVDMDKLTNELRDKIENYSLHLKYYITMHPDCEEVYFINNELEAETIENNSITIGNKQENIFGLVRKYRELLNKRLEQISNNEKGIKSNIQQSFDKYFINLHGKEQQFAEILKQNFTIEKGKNIRILLDYLIERKFLSIPHRGMKKFHEMMFKYFDGSIGAYQGIFDLTENDLRKIPKKPIHDKVDYCLSLLK